MGEEEGKSWLKQRHKVHQIESESIVSAFVYLPAVCSHCLRFVHSAEEALCQTVLAHTGTQKKTT